jgi:hypothetical protein
MMPRLLRLSIILLPLFASEASADRVKPVIYGKWSLYTSDEFEVAIGGKHIIIHDACVAEVVSGKNKFAFGTFSREMNTGNDEFSGLVIGQATSSNWKFKTHVARMMIRTRGNPSVDFVVDGTLYDDDMIVFSMGGYGSPPLELAQFAAIAMGEMSLSSETGRKLAKFPTDGLSSVYPELLQCGGIQAGAATAD